tara:strand:+ start:19580 stop:20035 length:456 start_codon:yes stop_codon:yes gene_type:complete
MTESSSQETSNALLTAAAGSYIGPNLLWFMDPNKPLESEGTAQVEGNEVRYTWSYEGKPQTGVMTCSFSDEGVSATLTDSWHTGGKPMQFTGDHLADAIVVNGTYAAGEGPDWGWRIELRVPGPSKLLIEMYNIQPDGVEQIAVRMRADRR